MAVIKPFKALRPASFYADKVSALPYDVMSEDEAREMVKDNPYSFLHVDKPEIDFPKGTVYDSKMYAKAKENLEKLISEGTLVKDEKDSLYIYQLSMNGRLQTGLVLLASVQEYLDGKIKKHELTRFDKENDRVAHVDACNAHTGPIFMAYRAKAEINALIEEYMAKNIPDCGFSASGNVTHKVWAVSDQAVVEKLVGLFEGLYAMYIADGHHRNAAAARVALDRRNSGAEDNEAEHYLAVAFPDDCLEIMDYNRVVKDLNGSTEEEFLAKVKESFEVEEVGCAEFKPEKLHTFGMYINKKWYKLSAKAKLLEGKDVIGCLDVSILQEELLNPILGVEDPRVSHRIDFVGGIRGLSELSRRVDSGECAVAFAMYPTSMEELFSVADNGLIMPPKSTWFEPKLLSGLFIHQLG